MTLYVLTAATIGLAMLAMAVGVLLGNRCLRGSCGVDDLRGPDGEPLSCEACPRRKERTSNPEPVRTGRT
jgi:hypothetical protein